MTQILISLGILALWALTSLLSRDAQPLPPRVARPRPGEPPSGPTAFPRNDQVAANLGRGTTQVRPAQGALGSRAADAGLGPRPASSLSPLSRDEFRDSAIDSRSLRSLSSASVSPASTAAPARGSRTPARRAVRTRSVASTGSAPGAEGGRSRQLSSQINQSMALATNRPLEITPLEVNLASLTSTLTPLGTRAASQPPERRTVPRATDAGAIRALLRSPENLREIAVLTELLKPPLALRPRQRFR